MPKLYQNKLKSSLYFTVLWYRIAWISMRAEVNKWEVISSPRWDAIYYTVPEPPKKELSISGHAHSSNDFKSHWYQWLDSKEVPQINTQLNGSRKWEWFKYFLTLLPFRSFNPTALCGASLLIAQSRNIHQDERALWGGRAQELERSRKELQQQIRGKKWRRKRKKWEG